MTRYVAWRFGLIVTAALLIAVRWPAGLVEQWYARSVYPPMQSIATGASNLVPFALLDALIVAGVLWLVWGVARVTRGGRGRRWRALARAVLNLGTVAAAAFIAFYGCWGLNYQREPVAAWLDFDESRITPDRAGALGRQIAGALVRLQTVVPPSAEGGDRQEEAGPLAPAFEGALRSIGLPGGTRPGRPKVSLLDPYFTRAGVSGMTDPFFLETLEATNLLPVERPAVIAHEWAHLAGLARESEASFVGWLACIHADEWAQYSGWLDLLLRVGGSLDANQRRQVMAHVPARVIRDIDLMRQRNERDQVRVVGLVAWRAYDSYLKTNRVESGIRNYDEVVRLVLGTRFESGWTPVRR
ncbi:MAG: DUF3810 family protein [Acidobacteria bacterium]|nr:DUF3810 family protein [Acidobacteriota bacterium]